MNVCPICNGVILTGPYTQDEIRDIRLRWDCDICLNGPCKPPPPIKPTNGGDKLPETHH